MDKISVVMCAYREPDFVLRRAVRSILNQHPDEFILVSDKPVNLPGVLWVPDPGRGKLAARNLGTDLATGDIIVAVDADAEYDPRFIRLLRIIFRDSKVVAVVGTPEEFDVHPPRFIYTPVVYFHRMHGRGSAFRKWAWDATGRFVEAVTGPLQMMWEEEYMFYERISQFGKVVYIPIDITPLREKRLKEHGIRKRFSEEKGV